MKLKIHNLTVGYDRDTVLTDLYLDMAEGEFLSLLGPSGCGKTTLMKAIAGILPPKAGQIFLDGTDITKLPIHKRGTVIVFQDMRLFPHKSVAENVAFPLKMQGVPRRERLERAEELLAKVQMAGYGNRRPMELSGGQQQRVALARALAAQPKLLLLDEPFSALDENLREDMRNLVLQLKREFHMTVILVTHDREEALSMSDRVALMFGGSLIQTGTPEEVYSRPINRQAADYFGNCVYIPGVVKDGVFAAKGIACPTARPDGPCCMMLRPDSLELGTGEYPLEVEAVSYRGSDTVVSFRGPDGVLWKKGISKAVHWEPGYQLQAAVHTDNAVFFTN
ncbi:MAG: ABC transporter ATP-binding protein [Oscillospiraceae bacterium]|nr:ABC transporter ATP-binding protein [Oscillospiraceae bacterium]